MLGSGLTSVDWVTFTGGLQVETDVQEAHDGLVQSEISTGSANSGAVPSWFAVKLPHGAHGWACEGVGAVMGRKGPYSEHDPTLRETIIGSHPMAEDEPGCHNGDEADDEQQDETGQDGDAEPRALLFFTLCLLLIVLCLRLGLVEDTIVV